MFLNRVQAVSEGLDSRPCSGRPGRLRAVLGANHPNTLASRNTSPAPRGPSQWHPVSGVSYSRHVIEVVRADEFEEWIRN